MKAIERLFSLGILGLALAALSIQAPWGILSATAQQTANVTTPESPPMDETVMTHEDEHQEEREEGTFTVRDSVFALLADQSIPGNDFIHLYDTTPYTIQDGHIAAKIPCDDDSEPMLDILVGVAPDFTPAPLELLGNLSSPGELCLYHVDLPITEHGNVTATNVTDAANNTTATTVNNDTATTITDIAILNPSDDEMTLPATSTVVIGVNEIAKGVHHEHDGHGQGHDEAQQETSIS
jgi:hypothetical protein